MLRNYLTVALRGFRKHTLYSTLNVFGLMLGLTVVVLIALFVRFELSYDKFHQGADRTYRIVQRQPGNVYLGSNEFAVTPGTLEDALRDELAYVEQATQINDMRAVVSAGESGFFDEGLFATPSFFELFDFELIRGDRATVLDEPNAIVVTSDFAQRVFGTEDAIGRSFELDYYGTIYTPTVTGIVAEPPPNAHFDFSWVLTYVGMDRQQNWGSNSYYTYVRLRSGADPRQFAEDLQAIVDRNMSELDWIREDDGDVPTFYAQRLAEIHLRSHINFEIARNGDIRYVWLLVIAAVIIVITACINYMNLATARAVTRAREVGVRKVVGANRMQLVRQFIGESLVLAAVATAAALVLASLLRPGFNILVERDIPASELATVGFLGITVVFGAIVGIVSGSYPAAVLSRMSPARILKSSASLRTSRSVLRNTLVVVQFAVGVALVVGTFVIREQLAYIGYADTGMDRDQVVAVTSRDRSLGEQWPALKTELERIPWVLGVTGSSHVPTNIQSSNGADEWDGREGDQEISVYVNGVTFDFADLLGLEIVEGRDFSRDRPSDEGNGIIINETTKRLLGWETAIGKNIGLGSTGTEVIGVVSDFQFHSFHLAIEPMALYLDTDEASNILIKVTQEDLPATLERVASVFGTFSPKHPFEYQFLDDAYDSLYRAERHLGLVLSVVTGLALVIACLGLFGLAAFMALQRTKEIGIRKALGAGVSDIVLLLSRDFGRLVLIAFVVGCPIAYLVMREWLSRFVFRAEIGPDIFIAAGLVTALVAFITVGYQSVKASRADPVRALRYE